MHRQYRQTPCLCEDDHSTRCYESQRRNGTLQVHRHATASKFDNLYSHTLFQILIPLQTKWGVGFGPRDCSDYATGVSIIPIDRLTDADRKWMLTAEYGGTGGKAIESGMVVEEPDIEIGAGVSSKGNPIPLTQALLNTVLMRVAAISRRMGTDKGGYQGPRSSERTGQAYDSAPRFRQPERQNRDNNNTIGVPPAVPGFGFQFPMMPNGMPMFPGAFPMPPGTPGQPPPPGAG